MMMIDVWVWALCKVCCLLYVYYVFT